MSATRTILPKDLDVTQLDQEALEARIFRLIDSVFPEWSERKRINFGNLLVGAMAMVGDKLAFIMDNHAGESRWSTAVLRRSLLAALKLIGYRPPSASAATVDIVLTLDAIATGTVTIPQGARALTSDITGVISYQLLADAVFAPGETTKTVTGEHSESWADVFVSSELADQVDTLGRAGVLDGSITVIAADGAYTEVSDFLDSTSTSRHFTVNVDAENRATVRYGNGINGSIPIATRTVSYKTGGGRAGVVEPGRLNRLDGSYVDSLGNAVRITITNPLKSAGGEDRESNAMIRVKGPRSLRVQNRCVSREDYEIVAMEVPGVARALHLTGNEDAGLGENQGMVLIVPDGGGTPSGAILDAVRARYEPLTGDRPKTNTYQVLVAGAPYVEVDHQATVYLVTNTPAARVAARAAIEASLELFYALTVTNDEDEEIDNPTVNFGYYLKGPLAWSDVFNAIRDSPGLLRVDPGPNGLLLNGRRDDVTLEPQQFPALGDIVLVDGLTGETF